MKSFKFLGALALLTGAMLVATSCNKKDNEPTSGEFPTLNEILGSWVFDEIPEGWEGIPGVDLDVEDVYVCLDERGSIYMGTLQNFITGQYSYSAADGTLTITVSQQQTDIPASVATLTKGPGADQLTISIPLVGSTTITKVCDKNYLFGECKDEPVDPVGPELPEEGSIPAALDLVGTWEITAAAEDFFFPFMPGSTPVGMFIWLSSEEQDLIAMVGTMDRYEENFQYEYDEATGLLKLNYVRPTDGAEYEFEGTLAYDDQGNVVCSYSNEETGGTIVLHKECDLNMFLGECTDPVPTQYPNLLGSWEVISELPEQLAGLAFMLEGNAPIIYFGTESENYYIGVGAEEIGAKLDGDYTYNEENGILDANLKVFAIAGATVTNFAENQIQLEWNFEGNPIQLILEFRSEDNILIH